MVLLKRNLSFLLLLIALVGLGLTMGRAGAAPGADAPPWLTLLPAQGDAGIEVLVQGGGLPPFGVVEFYWNEETSAALLGETSADGDGNVEALIEIPAGAGPDLHTILGVSPNLARTFALDFRVTEAPEITLSPGRGAAGSMVHVHVENLSPMGSISLLWDGVSWFGPAALEGQDIVDLVLAVDEGASMGPHEIVVQNHVLGRLVGEGKTTFEVIAGTGCPPLCPTIDPPAGSFLPGGSLSFAATNLPPQSDVLVQLLAPWSTGAFFWDGSWTLGEGHTTLEGELAIEVTLPADTPIGDLDLCVLWDSGLACEEINLTLAPGEIELQTWTCSASTPRDRLDCAVGLNPWLPLAEVEVVINDRTGRTVVSGVTDANGRFQSGPISAGTYDVVVGRCGYGYHHEPGETNLHRRQVQLLPGATLEVGSGPIPSGDEALLFFATGGDTSPGCTLVPSFPGPPVANVIPAIIDPFLRGAGVPDVMNGFCATVLEDATRVTFELNSQVEEGVDTGDNRWCSPRAFNMSTLPVGVHTLTVHAYDERGMGPDPCSDDTPIITGLPTLCEVRIVTVDSIGWNQPWLEPVDITFIDDHITDDPDTWHFAAAYLRGDYDPARGTLEGPFVSTTSEFTHTIPLPAAAGGDVAVNNRLTVAPGLVPWTVTFPGLGTDRVKSLMVNGLGEIYDTADGSRLGVFGFALSGQNRVTQNGRTRSTTTFGPFPALPWSRNDDDGYQIDFPLPIPRITPFTVPTEQAVEACIFDCFDVGFFDGVLTVAPRATVDIGMDVDPNLALGGIHLTPDVYPLTTANVRFEETFFGNTLATFTASTDRNSTLTEAHHFTPPTASQDDACTGMLVDFAFEVLGFISGGGELLRVETPAGCAGLPARRVLPTSKVGAAVAPSLAAPAVASDGHGHALAVWMEPAASGNSSGRNHLLYSHWNGARWSAAAPLAGPSYAGEPQVAFLDPGRAIAIWTENTLAAAEMEEVSSLVDLVTHNEIYYSEWDGSSWSVPAPLTNDSVRDGQPSLTASPAQEELLAVWSRGGSNSDIYAARWDGSEWSAPAPVAAGNTRDTLARAAYDSTGVATVAWVRDGDGDSSTDDDRQLMVASWNGSAWSAATAASVNATGAQALDVAFDNAGRLLLAFTAVSDGAGTAPDNYALYSAYRRDGGWEQTLVTEALALQRPRLLVGTADQARLIYRRFDAGRAAEGTVALSQADLGDVPLAWSAARAITPEDGAYYGYPAAALDGQTGGLHLAYAASAAEAEARQAAHSPGETGVLVTRLLAEKADLAVTEISVSDAYPAVGATVEVSATVANAGLADADTFLVRFYQGTPENGVLLAERKVGGLDVVEGMVVQLVPWTAVGGEQRITVVADAANTVGEADESNNRGQVTVGRPPAPGAPGAVLVDGGKATLLRWTEPTVDGEPLYRIYRAQGDDEFRLVGVVRTPSFQDMTTEPETPYRYRITVEDKHGIESAPSRETTAVVEESDSPQIFLPLISR